jgi:hypothetical protein
LKILEKFVPYSLSKNVWIKYKHESKQVEWLATFTLSGKIILKDSENNIVLSTNDESEFQNFLIREDRDKKINKLL